MTDIPSVEEQIKNAVSTTIKDIRAQHEETLIVVTGRIIHKSERKVVADTTRYECPSCGQQFTIFQRHYDTIQTPGKCSCGRKGNFRQIGIKKVDARDLTIQDNTSNITARNVPEKDIEQINEGDTVKVIGILSFEPEKTRNGGATVQAKPQLYPIRIELMEKGKGTFRNPVSYLQSLDGYQFEELTAELLMKKGYPAKVNPKSGDGGIDIETKINNELVLVQCKHHFQKVFTDRNLREFNGVMKHQEVSKGLFVITGYFSESAVLFAKKNNILLWDLNMIMGLLYNYAEHFNMDPEQKPLHLMTGQEIKRKGKVLFKLFKKRMNEVRKAMNQETVPIDAVQGLFSVEDWQFLEQFLYKENYVVDYSDQVIYEEQEDRGIDMSRICTEIPEVQRQWIILVKEIIAELENKLGKAIPLMDIVSESTQKGMTTSEVEEIIQKLMRSGDIIESRQGFISRI